MEPKKCASPFIEKHLPAIMTVIAFSSLLIIWDCVARFSLLLPRFYISFLKASPFPLVNTPCHTTLESAFTG